MKRRKPPRRIVSKAPCAFCKKDIQPPDYKDADSLRPYLTDKARLLSRIETGICAKHQRQLTTEVKRARHLALLPFVSGDI